ncbi:DNA replication complex GINS protein sld5 [Schizosaccharomyces pombe]|uniref:DNA replication complex GINS protein sld5 n=1 Tax=Schizosaccharomyces pombe (strain 972 / ATCC 24843) TaxID=284812 RepID=SLD5_SCHPO|nr:GINS complex subunit Sld5 [Schizosaccharomyces pombe]Q9P7C8.1 RecName: Full=DNA replication complex GINS protein sld5 [Schizosaccharomyces pombe 972h-]CAB83179.1 GINS complex subunit Sld5 [Schizosaccharomyces pombe]|eukprot:NP_596195.1 GINS complex subunit Sld5 [Schizosaccharomyces pombe]
MEWDADDLLIEPTTEVENDYEDLCTQWVNERMAPDLLPFAEEIVSRVLDRIEAQRETLQLAIGTSSATSYRSVLMQTELERVKFVLRSYMRTRINKIDKYAQYIQSHPNLLLYLSSPERQYLLRHQQIVHRHYMDSFLREVPAKMNKLDDKVGNLSMVASPDMDTAVFCVVNESVEENFRVSENEYITLDKGDVLILRYSVISDYLRLGVVSLI